MLDTPWLMNYNRPRVDAGLPSARTRADPRRNAADAAKIEHGFRPAARPVRSAAREMDQIGYDMPKGGRACP